MMPGERSNGQAPQQPPVANGKGNGGTPPLQKHKSDGSHAEAIALVRRMGSPNGYSPVPPSQHQWQRGPSEPPLHRIWSWLLDHTVAWGHRCEYAVDKEGKELHMEHLIADLDMDESNAYRYWRIGVERGLWRNGDKRNGPRRLFLAGDVPAVPVSASGEETANPAVCTNQWPSHISKQIKDWPKEQREKLRAAIDREEGLEKQVQAAVIAASRAIFTERQHTLLEGFGIKPKRIDYKKTSETAEDAAARRSRFEPILPQLHWFVQTVEQSVQTQPETVYTTDQVFAQTAATLLPVEGRKQQEIEACVNSDASCRPAGNPPHDGERSHGLLHAHGKPDGAREASEEKPKTPDRTKLPELHNAEDKAAEALFFSEIRNMQQTYPRSGFGQQLISPSNKADQLFVRRLFHTVGAGNVLQFLIYVAGKFKGLDNNSLGKQQPRAPGYPNGPRSLGLILAWAEDFAREIRPPQVAAQIRREEVAACTAILRERNADPAQRWYAIELLKLHGVKLGLKDEEVVQ